MSSALAIAATTETLRSLLEERVKSLTGNNDLHVTAKPPDVAGKDNPDDVKPQLNLFLYQTAFNGAWRNLDMPRQVRPGEVGRPPLALNLHYLVTAYGLENGTDQLSHKVLGAAMSFLHDHPVLTRDEIVPTDTGLRDQFELLKITPLPMSLEDLSKLWMIFQTEYRISAAYEVAVVLIDSRAAPAPLPVLKRGKEDRGATAIAGAVPNLREIRLPRSQPAARLGESIALLGDQLTTDATKVRFMSTRGLVPVLLEPAAGPSPGEISVAIPDAAADMSRWAPGFYTLALVQERADTPQPLVSNELAFALAPLITVTFGSAPEDADHFTVDVTVQCKPSSSRRAAGAASLRRAASYCDQHLHSNQSNATNDVRLHNLRR